MRATTFIVVFILALSTSAKHGEGESEADPAETPISSSSSSVSASITQSTLTPPSAVPSSESTATSFSPSLSPSPSLSTPPSVIPTATSNADTSVPTNALQFLPPPNVTICDKATLSWEFAAPAHIPVTIVVSNQTMQANSSSKQTQPVMSRTLSTTVDALLCEVVWPAVNVPPGQYHAIAFDTARNLSLSAVSSPFFVSGGSNTSCLNSSSTSADSSSSESPSSTKSGSKNLSSGALIGTIAGVLVGVGGLVAAFTLPRMCQRSRRTPRPGAPYQTF